MGEPARKKHCSWDEYRPFPNDERWEIIAGEAYAMSPGFEGLALDLAAMVDFPLTADEQVYVVKEAEPEYGNAGIR